MRFTLRRRRFEHTAHTTTIARVTAAAAMMIGSKAPPSSDLIANTHSSIRSRQACHNTYCMVSTTSKTGRTGHQCLPYLATVDVVVLSAASSVRSPLLFPAPPGAAVVVVVVVVVVVAAGKRRERSMRGASAAVVAIGAVIGAVVVVTQSGGVVHVGGSGASTVHFSPPPVLLRLHSNAHTMWRKLLYSGFDT